MCIKFTLWRTEKFSVKKTILISLLVISAFFLLNFNLVFTIKHEIIENKTFIDVCLHSKVMVSWLYVIKFFELHFNKLKNKYLFAIG